MIKDYLSSINVSTIQANKESFNYGSNHMTIGIVILKFVQTMDSLMSLPVVYSGATMPFLKLFSFYPR